MNKQENLTKPNQQETEEGFPWQLKILLVGIVVGIIVWILEFAGMFH